MHEKHQKLTFEVSLKEILNKMEQVQHKNRPYDPSKKLYLKYRRVLVDWMCDLGDSINISQNTIHHSVAMMDTYFSKIHEP